MTIKAVWRYGGKAVGVAARRLSAAGLTALLFTALPPYRLTAQQRYFQQDIRYTIAASLDEPSGILAADGELVYRNNSPDTLREIYFHQYLNAFRPGSLWSRDERREGIDRFAGLPDPYSAFEHFERVQIAGRDVAPEYPNAPDSTIAKFALPAPLPPGDSLRVLLRWTARPSVIPRRQGREGRRFDFAQWYPKVCVYDRGGWQAHPLRLAGELYGEFGSYDVTLDLAEDQVVAATGVPVEGDPGWERANAGSAPVTLQRDWYRVSLRPTPYVLRPVPGRKLVRFYADHIHHFAFSLNPEYRYEEGRYGDVVLRTFYLPGDSATWGGGRVIERTGRAMAWLDTIFGAYPYPQTVVLHRIEDGGTEFPMLVMNGGPEESLIFHEVGHIYTYGILANNEWREAWLDEGFTTFQTAWNFQRRGMGVPSPQVQQLILSRFDLDARSEPVGMAAERFSEFGIYNRMVYTKAQLVYEMLRYVVGEDRFRRGLRLYYDRWKLRHVDGYAFREAMEDASGTGLGEFFEQWLHQEPMVDYAVGGVNQVRLIDGGWLTRIKVERKGDGVMPVVVALHAGDTTYTARTAGYRPTEEVEIRTREKPGRVELDPDRQTMDWNYLNNESGTRFLPLFVGARSPGPEVRLGWSGSAPARRDRLVQNWLPLAWYSDAGGVTVGVQERTNYLGRLDQHAFQLAYATREGFPNGLSGYLAVRNPTWLQAARTRWGFELWGLDGRYGGTLWANQDRSRRLTYGPRITLGSSLEYMKVYDSLYVDPFRWNHLYTLELAGFSSIRWTGDVTRTELRGTGSLGLAGTPNHFGSQNNRTYMRVALELTHRRQAGRLDIGGRLLAAAVPHFSSVSAPRQRQLFVAGADPYQTFMNPFLRSQGALFVKPDVNYSAPGGLGLRGFTTDLIADRAMALSLEAAFAVLKSPGRRLFSTLSLAVFADGAWLYSADSVRTALGPTAGDAGFGIRAAHRIGPTSFVTRLDFPVLVTAPASAAGAVPGDGRTKFRFVWSLEDAF